MDGVALLVRNTSSLYLLSSGIQLLLYIPKSLFVRLTFGHTG